MEQRHARRSGGTSAAPVAQRGARGRGRRRRRCRSRRGSARKRSGFGRGREERLHVADRHRRADPHQRVVGQRRLEPPRTPAPRTVLGVAAKRCRHQLVGRPASSRASRCQRASRGASTAVASASQRRGRDRPCSSVSAVRVGSCQARVRVDHHLVGRPASQARSGFEVGMSPTRRTRSGRCARGERRVAQQHVVVGDDVRAVVRAAAQPGRRLGEDRPAGAAASRATASAQSSLRRRRRRRSPRAARRRSAPPAPARRRRRARSSARAARTHGRPSARPCPVGGVELLGHRRQRLAQREVEVHRARAGRRRPCHRRGRRARGGASPVAPRLVVAHLHEPLGRASRTASSWSIACPAPTSRSSGGRSAVSTISGTRASRASTTAGSRFAAAVPEVQVTATGRPVAFAIPSATKPAERSSIDRHALDPLVARRASARSARCATPAR